MSIKFLYSKEARDAVDKINSKPISVLNMSGKATKDIGKEGIQGLYSLTLVKNKVLGPSSRNKEAETELHTLFDGKKGNVTLDSVLKIIDKYDVDTTVQWGGKFTTLGRVIFNEVIPTGNLKVGNYVLYFRYEDADGNETDFVAESGIISIFKGSDKDPFSIDGGIADMLAYKTIHVTLQNIDSAYDYVKVYVVRTSA